MSVGMTETVLVALGAIVLLAALTGFGSWWDKREQRKRDERLAAKEQVLVAGPVQQTEEAKVAVAPNLPKLDDPTVRLVVAVVLSAGIGAGIATMAGPSTTKLEQRVQDLEGRVGDLRYEIDRLRRGY